MIFVEKILLQTDDVLAFVVVYEVHGLQRGDDVLLLDAGLFADLVDGELGGFPLLHRLSRQNHLESWFPIIHEIV